MKITANGSLGIKEIKENERGTDKNYINENKRMWEANELSVEEIAERCLLDGEQLGVDKLNDTARLLQILKDRGVIKSWYYNGSYHIGEVAELEKENETLEQGYIWDYMTQAKITTKIVTKEKGVTMFEKEAYEKGMKIRKGKIPRACSNCKSKDTCSAFIPLGRCRIGYKE